jgi:hypothetical protein
MRRWLPPPERARAAWLLAALPVVVVTARALARGWLPVGDNAFFAIRASDVLTAHHPMVGAWSSGSLAVGVNVNNLGPLQLQLLALPVKVDWMAGTAVGVAATNIAAIALACVFAGRIAGPLASMVTAVGAAGLVWTLGELLYEPRTHHALLLPFFAYLVLVWAVASGHLQALPWAVLAGSLVLQSHLTYAVLVPVMGLFALAGLGLSLRRERREGEEVWSARRAAAARWGGVTAAVSLAVWAHPILDQLFGRGNLGSVVRAASVDQETAGAGHAARALATVLTEAPWWFPPSFRDFDPQTTVVGAGRAAAGLLVVAAALVAAGLVARRRGDRAGSTAVAASGVVLVGAWAAGTSQTAEPPFGLVAGNYRWLWSVSAFVWLSVAFVAVRALAGTVRAERRALTGTGLVLVAFVLLSLLPASTADIVRHDERLMGVSRDLVAQLGPLEGRGPVLVQRGGLFFREPYTYVLMAGLQDRGIDWRVGADDALRYGQRRARVDDLAGVVRLASGDAALEPGPAEERIAFATRFTAEEERELLALRREAEPSRADRERLGELEGRWNRETVAVMYEPIDPGGER